MAGSTGDVFGGGDDRGYVDPNTSKPSGQWAPGGAGPPPLFSDQFQKISAPWWALGDMFPELYDMMGQQGPGFQNGMPDYGYGQSYVDPSAGGFGWEDLWGPMAQQMEGQSKAQMARLREEFGTGSAGSARYSSPLMMAQEAGLAQTAADMNRQMSELQYQDRIAADQRQRQVMQDLLGQGQQEQATQQAALDMGYQDWLRRQGWGTDQAARFLGQGYQPDYLVDPGGDEGPDKTMQYAAIAASLFGSMLASDENIKEDFSDVDNEEMLEKVKQLKVKGWKYRGDDADHVGPMAQQFKELFGTGPSDKFIMAVDANGVILSTLQAMIGRIEDLEAA